MLRWVSPEALLVSANPGSGAARCGVDKSSACGHTSITYLLSCSAGRRSSVGWRQRCGSAPERTNRRRGGGLLLLGSGYGDASRRNGRRADGGAFRACGMRLGAACRTLDPGDGTRTGTSRAPSRQARVTFGKRVRARRPTPGNHRAAGTRHRWTLSFRPFVCLLGRGNVRVRGSRQVLCQARERNGLRLPGGSQQYSNDRGTMRNHAVRSRDKTASVNLRTATWPEC